MGNGYYFSGPRIKSVPFIKECAKYSLGHNRPPPPPSMGQQQYCPPTFRLYSLISFYFIAPHQPLFAVPFTGWGGDLEDCSGQTLGVDCRKNLCECKNFIKTYFVGRPSTRPQSKANVKITYILHFYRITAESHWEQSQKTITNKMTISFSSLSCL